MCNIEARFQANDAILPTSQSSSCVGTNGLLKISTNRLCLAQNYVGLYIPSTTTSSTSHSSKSSACGWPNATA